MPGYIGLKPIGVSETLQKPFGGVGLPPESARFLAQKKSVREGVNKTRLDLNRLGPKRGDGGSPE